MGIGERVRQLREACGWTQEELAQRAGVTQGYISRLERAGPGKKGYAPQTARVADALNVSGDCRSGPQRVVKDATDLGHSA